jgi:hypothetical protein
MVALALVSRCQVAPTTPSDVLDELVAKVNFQWLVVAGSHDILSIEEDRHGIARSKVIRVVSF